MLVVGRNGNVHAKSATIDTEKNGFGPSNTVAYFGTLLLRHVTPFQISPAPKFPLPSSRNSTFRWKTDSILAFSV